MKGEKRNDEFLNFNVRKNLALMEVNDLYKKFCKDLRYNMIYSIKDLTGYFFGKNPNYIQLRKKEFWALQNINFKIFENEITVLVGTNGSGKTTLIRMLAGIYDVERGAIEYNKKVKKIISVFAIKSGFHSVLTGRENIYLKGAYYGMTEIEVKHNMDFIISFSGLSEYMDTPLGKFSSGMKTRLAMSLVLSIDADILFIDEGFSFSDPGFKSKCFSYLKKQYTKEGKALIIATHRLGKIQRLANRMIILDKGKIINSTHDIEKGLDLYSKLYVSKE